MIIFKSFGVSPEQARLATRSGAADDDWEVKSLLTGSLMGVENVGGDGGLRGGLGSGLGDRSGLGDGSGLESRLGGRLK